MRNLSKRLGEWGIDLSHFKLDFRRFSFWKRSVLWKLMLLNVAVIGIVIWLAGVSVKDFACLLVNQLEIIGEQRSRVFNETLQYYLIRASLVAVVVAAVLHFYFVRKITLPLQKLVAATRMMKNADYPDPLPVKSQDEVGELTRGFNELSLKLKQVEGMRSKLLSDIAHELRTPLTNINGYLEALSSGILNGNQELYHSLHEESLRLIRLVEQLHQLNIWESKKTSVNQFKVILMTELIEQCIKAFEWEFKNKYIRMELDLESGKVMGDSDGLKQVMGNLFKNALEYDEDRWVHIRGKVQGDKYVVTVTNQGKPIPTDQSNQIFERFHRLEPSRNRKTGGAGLGLSIVKEIVEMHGGQVGFNTTEGNHHSFWFTLPIA